MATQIAIRRGSADQWTADNPVLGTGEPGLDETNLVFKIGDGVTHWLDLVGVQFGASGNPTPPPVEGGVLSIAGPGGTSKTGVVTLAISDISDVSGIGANLATAADASTARQILGVSSLLGNTVTLTGSTALRNDPTTNIPLPAPPQCTVLWISSTAPDNLLTGDIWVNDPNL